MSSMGQQSVALISSSENRAVGTGFVIHCEGGTSYVATCEHLIAEVGGPGKVLVDGISGTVLAREDGDEVDLAVVCVREGRLAKPALRLSRGGVAAALIQVIGYHSEGGAFRQRLFNGKLGSQVFFASSRGAVGGWDLEIDGPWALGHECIGSPVIDCKSGTVLGMVVAESREGHPGTAISLEVLRVVWADLPTTILPGESDSETSSATPLPGRGPEYDVFLSYNTKDKPTVDDLATMLKARGVEVWMDVDLLPGQRWQPSLERGIASAKSVAVCIGEHGLGPWQEEEVSLSLTREMEARRAGTAFAVIPVLLPEATEGEALPEMLRQRVQVDLREGLSAAGIGRLVDGIRQTHKLGGAGGSKAWDVRPEIDTEGLEPVRQDKLDLLATWISGGCRIIVLSGMQGIGKTSLARQLGARMREEFNVIGRSLAGHPPLQKTVEDILQVLGEAEPGTPAGNAEPAAPQRLQRILTQHRCLLILDDYDCILRSDGMPAPDFENYAFALRMLAEEEHGSCVLVCSRIVPQDVNQSALDYPIRRLRLSNLGVQDGRRLLEARYGLSGSPEDWRKLVRVYGSPAYLEIVGRYIAHRYACHVRRFLAKHHVLLEIEQLLDHQWEELSDFQRSVVRWLAIRRVPCSREDLQRDLLGHVTQQELSRDLSLLENLFPVKTKQGTLYSLHWLAMQQVSRTLVDEVCKELITGHPALLQTHALLTPSSPEDVCEMQRQDIIKPILERLGSATDDAEHRLRQCLLSVPKLGTADMTGYAAANLLNLLLELGCTLQGCDFSNTYVREADLRRRGQLQGADFRNCRFSKCAFLQPLGSVLSVAFHPTEPLFAAGDSRGSVYVWDLTQGTLRCLFEEHSTLIWGLAFSSSGTLATGCADGTIKLFDVEGGGRVVGSLEDLGDRNAAASDVTAIAWSQAGDRLASGGRDRMIRLWDVGRRNLICRWIAHDDMVHCLSFGLDDSLLASGGSDRTAKLWKLDDRTELARLEHDEAVYAVAFDHRGGQVATGGADRRVRIWEVADSAVQLVHALGGHQGPISSCVFFDDGRGLVTGSHDRTIKVWNRDDSGRWHTRHALRGHISGVNRVAVQSDRGTILCSGGEDQSVHIWNLEKGSCLGRIVGFDNAVNAVRFLDAKTLASGSDDHLIRIWDWKQPVCEKSIFAPTGRVNYLAVGDAGQVLASGHGDGSVRLWHRSAHRDELVGRHADNGSVVGLAFHPKDSGMLASIGSDREVRVWGAGGRVFAAFPASGRRGAVAFSPDGQTLALSHDDGSLGLWDVATRKEKCRLAGHWGFLIHALAFSPDGAVLASSADDKLVRLWHLVDDGGRSTELRGHEDYVTDLAFHPEGHLLASASGDRTVRLWRMAGGECEAVLREHWRAVHSVAFGPTGDVLASGGADAMIIVWDMATNPPCPRIRIPLPGPYEGMRVAGATFAGRESNWQVVALKRLGADNV